MNKKLGYPTGLLRKTTHYNQNGKATKRRRWCGGLLSLVLALTLLFSLPGLSLAVSITEYPLPTSSSYPRGITSGPDSNLWFTENSGNQIGKITPTGTLTEYPIPTSSSVPTGITSGSDGNLWFTEAGGNKIGKLSPLDSPTLGLSFSPASVAAGGTSNLTFNLANPNSNTALTNLSFGTTLPTGLTVVSGSAVANSCGATGLPTPGSTAINLSVPTLAGGANCSVTIGLTASTAKTYPVAVTAISSDQTGTSTVSASATLSVTPGPAALVAVMSGGGQSATINTAFAAPLVAKVTDSFSNPVSSTSVTFTAPASGTSGTFTGGLTTFTGTTDASGTVTTTTFTANSKAGAYNVNATVSAVTNPASFGLTNTVGAISTLTALSGTPQSAVISTPFSSPLVARVTDAGSNPVSGTSVTFTAPTPANGPTGTFAGGSNVYTGLTDASGTVTTTIFTANAITGTYTVSAMVNGVTTPASFGLTNLAACDPLQVTSTADNNNCGTLRQAVLAASSGPTKTVTINLAAGSTINLTSGLTLTNGLIITTTASCGSTPPIIIMGNGPNNGDGLTFSGTNTVSNLWVRGFSGRQLVTPLGSHAILRCVRASKT